MKVLSSLMLAASINAIGIGSASATVIFSDNFDTYSYKLEAIAADFANNWVINSGSVDLIGNDTTVIPSQQNYDFIPGNGMYVDLDGSTNAGGFFSTNDFSLNAGTYVIQFSLAGSQNPNNDNDVTVTFGSFTETFTLLSSDLFQSYSRTVTLGSALSTALAFKNSGGDNVGALLDNVSVTAVPEPSTYGLMFGGLIMVAGLVARKSRQS